MKLGPGLRLRLQDEQGLEANPISAFFSNRDKHVLNTYPCVLVPGQCTRANTYLLLLKSGTTVPTTQCEC